MSRDEVMLEEKRRGPKSGRRMRVIATLALVQLMMRVMRLLRRQASYLPGALVCKLFPDFLRYVHLPQTLIAVTGTNGKTTVSNLLVGCFEARGLRFVDNRYGSNTIEGVTTALISGLDWRGRSRVEYAILEIDELSSRRIFPLLTPDFLLVTNLFRDSYQRNAHPEFIFDVLESHVPPATHLILNAEDPISCRLRPENERVYFALSPELDWVCGGEDIVCDLRACPYCGQELERRLVRFHHIGRWFCPHCGFCNPRPDYSLEDFDEQSGELGIRETDGSCYRYRLLGKSCVDRYSNLAAIAVLRELGWTHEQITKAWRGQTILRSRHDSRQLCGLPMDVLLGKALNPVASSRMIDFICRQTGRKAVVLFNTYMLKDHLNLENTGWLYEIDYERLKREDVVQILIGARRAYDYKVRLELAGIDPSRISLYRHLDVPGEALKLEGIERVCVLHDINNMAETDAFLTRVERANAHGA